MASVVLLRTIRILSSQRHSVVPGLFAQVAAWIPEQAAIVLVVAVVAGVEQVRLLGSQLRERLRSSVGQSLEAENPRIWDS